MLSNWCFANDGAKYKRSSDSFASNKFIRKWKNLGLFEIARSYSGRFFLKAVNSIDDNVRVSRRIYIPSSRLRGFESGKIGPKDGNEYVGGNFGSALNLNSTLPNFFSGNDDIDLNLFFDAATVREVDYDSSLESDEIRSATGVAVNWYTVIGPLSFSYAIPLNSEPSDKTESFRFRIGTSF